VHKVGLGVPPLYGALSLLYRRSFQQVSQLLVNMLSSIVRGFRDRSHDHGGCHDILAGSREDGRLSLALLDLIIHAVCPCLRALGIEVLRARASVITALVGIY
jgi:hypothetical protein